MTRTPLNWTARALPLLAAGAVVAGSSGAHAQDVPHSWQPQSPPDEIHHPTGDLFIENLDAIWTANDEVLENASILIRDGIIEEMGPDVSDPGDVETVDGDGLSAMPGIVDEHSHIATAGGLNEGTAPVVPEVRVLDALNPEDFSIYRALQGGVTTARIMHGSSNPIGGQSAVIKPRWGMEEGRELLLPGAPRSVKFALGENVTRMGSTQPLDQRRFPASRPGVEALYEQAFKAAEDYREVHEAYEANPDTFRVAPRRDLRLETLVDIMEDDIKIHAHSYRSDEMLMLLRVAERFGFQIENFTHAMEGYRIASEMAEHGAGGSTFTDWWQFKLEAYNSIPHNATIMNDQGVLTAINSDIPWLQTFMNWEIQKPVRYGGASREESLRMATRYPAEMMGVDAWVGTLEEGKHGDVVLLTGDPFDSFSRVQMTIVDGLIYYDYDREDDTRDEPFFAFEDAAAVAPATPAGGGDEEPEEATGEASAASAASTPEAEPSDGGSAASEGVSDDAGGEAPRFDRSDSATPPDAEAPTVALTGGTVHPVSQDPIEDGVVVMSEGRIQDVGPEAQVDIPDDAQVVDVSGQEIYPGMTDLFSYLGLFEMGQIPQGSDQQETGQLNPHVRSIAGYHAHGRAVNVSRAAGITSVFTTQSAGIVPGMGGFVDLGGDTWERAEILDTGGLVVNFPAPTEAPNGSSWDWEFFEADHGHADMRAGGAPEPFGTWMRGRDLPMNVADDEADEPEPTLEGEDMEMLVELFQRAERFAAEPSVTDEPDAPFEANVWGGDRAALEAMVPVVEGEVPVFFQADSEWQIRTVFAFLDEFPDVEPVVVGGVQAFQVADELAERDVPVVLTGTRNPAPDRDHSVAASMRNASVLHAAGVRFAFGTDDSADVRTLPDHAAIAVSYGLPEEEGLRAVTEAPAEILGIGDEMGTLEPGKRADVIVTNGNPLQIITEVDRMFIGGHEVDPLDNDHDRFHEEFRDRN